MAVAKGNVHIKFNAVDPNATQTQIDGGLGVLFTGAACEARAASKQVELAKWQCKASSSLLQGLSLLLAPDVESQTRGQTARTETGRGQIQRAG